jgi:hypothetical protein
MKSVERDGVRIAYEERGSGEAAFVFVHSSTSPGTTG